MGAGDPRERHFDRLNPYTTTQIEEIQLNPSTKVSRELKADLVVIGGGLGGISATLSAARCGATVILVEELDWLGGQLTAQGVPLDEPPCTETLISSQSYADFRARIRNYYQRNFPLTAEVQRRRPFNPGMGNVSTLCHEPTVSVQVLAEMISQYAGSSRVILLRRHKVLESEVSRDTIEGLTLLNLESGNRVAVSGRIFIDATETGELLESAGVEHICGAESQADTGEPHAVPGAADPLNQQAITWCFAMDYRPGEIHTIERPKNYEFWRNFKPDFWPGPLFGWLVSDHVTHKTRSRPLFAGNTDEEYLFDLWHARRIAYRKNFEPGHYASDITLACWPQMEYWLKPTIGVSAEDHGAALEGAREVSKSFVYWLQTDAPREDGGAGYPGLRLRPDVLGTEDGLAKQAYYRESRRIKAEFTLLEQHIAYDARRGMTSSEKFKDSVGIGAYRIDLHISTRGDNTIDLDTYPFQIPLGTLLPTRVDNLLPACKNLGTTRITSGACRVHSIEWSIGEASGALAATAIRLNVPPRAIRADQRKLVDFQRMLGEMGVMLEWPTYGVLTAESRIGYRPPPA